MPKPRISLRMIKDVIRLKWHAQLPHAQIAATLKIAACLPFSEEDETAVEDTLLKSLSRIVDADREILRKERRLAGREKGMAELAPILEAGKSAQALQKDRDTILRGLRKDVALLRHFGL